MRGFDEGRARVSPRVGGSASRITNRNDRRANRGGRVGWSGGKRFLHALFPLSSPPRIINHQSHRHQSLLRYNLVDPFNVARYAALINPANVAASIRHAKLEKRSLESADGKFPIPSSRFIWNFSKIPEFTPFTPRNREDRSERRFIIGRVESKRGLIITRGWACAFLSRRILLPGSSSAQLTRS